MTKEKIQNYKDWLSFLNHIRIFMSEQGFQEVVTPNLVSSPAMESTLHGFEVVEAGHKSVGYLPTSPEFALKKLWLTGDFNKIFEISKSFRACEEQSALHLPEFHMLEIYLADVERKDFVHLLESLFARVFGFKDLKFQEVCLADLFHKTTGEKITPCSDTAFLEATLKKLGIFFSEGMSFSDLYNLLFIEVLEPSFCTLKPLLIKNYPPSLAALSKLNDLGWASRFEVVYKGVELANAYDELLEREEHLSRWNKENDLRVKESLKPHVVDEVLLEALSFKKIKSGWGVAIGLERLFSLSKKRTDISVWPF